MFVSYDKITGYIAIELNKWVNGIYCQIIACQWKRIGPKNLKGKRKRLQIYLVGIVAYPLIGNFDGFGMLDSCSQIAVLFKTISRPSHANAFKNKTSYCNNDFLMRIAHSDLKLGITFGNHKYFFLLYNICRCCKWVKFLLQKIEMTL